MRKGEKTDKMKERDGGLNEERDEEMNKEMPER